MATAAVIIISIILNFILVLSLYFKSALNDILKDWWHDKKKKKEDAIIRLIDFKTKFNIQNVQCLLVIINLAQKQTNLIFGKEVDQYTRKEKGSHQKKRGQILTLPSVPCK